MLIAALAPAALAALALPPATPDAGGEFGWHYVVHAEETPAEEDTDSAGFLEPGTGNAFARAFKDFKLTANATGTYVTVPSLIGAAIQAQFETDVEVDASWTATTSAFYVPDPEVQGDQGFASAEAEVSLDGELHCEDYPASFAFALSARVDSTVLLQPVVVQEKDAGTFTKSNHWTLGVGGTPSGATGSLSFSGTAGAFGGGWTPVHLYYGPHYEKGLGEECANTYEHRYKVKVKGTAAAGKGYILPGVIDFAFHGFAQCSEGLAACDSP